MTNLTSKQENFARSVAQGKTYADAYRESYNVGEKRTQNYIYVESSKLMDNPNITIRIKEIKEENLKRNQATLDEVLNEMANWLRFDPIDMFNDDDSMKAISELKPEVRKSITSFEVVELFERNDKEKVHIGNLKRVKLVDKRSTADMFLRQMGQYVNKFAVETEDLSHLEDIVKSIDGE